MPVVLEEFGAKSPKRYDVFKAAFDSCLASAKRGGSCVGVMFWILYHKGTGAGTTILPLKLNSNFLFGVNTGL